MDISSIRKLIAEEHISSNAKDGLDRIVDIIGPSIIGKSGSVITPNYLHSKLEDVFGWKVTIEICELILSRLSKRNFIRSETANESVVYFFKNDENNNENGIIEELSNEFEKYLDLNKTNFTKKSIDRINNIKEIGYSNFFSQILDKFDSYIDFEDMIQSKGNNEINADMWENTLFSNFIFYLKEENIISNIVELISEIIIIREIVDQYSVPISDTKLHNLTIFLDTNPALSYLGVSGAERKNNASLTIDMAKELGASIQVLPSTLLEMKSALFAVLNEVGWRRYGPTGTAIRRGEVKEMFVRDVANDPEKHLRKLGINRAIRTLDMYPNEHQFFDEARLSRLINQASWTENQKAIEYDCESVTIAMRMRKGRHQRNMLKSKSIIVTHNGSFARQVRDFCIREHAISEYDSSVVVKQKFLAAQLWLMGGSSISKEIPKANLYSACENVIRNNKGVLEKIRSTTENLDQSEIQQIEAMLEDRRCIDMISKATFNDPKVVTSENISDILELMRKGLLEEEIAKREKIKHDYQLELSQLDGELSETKSQHNVLSSKFIEIENELKYLKSKSEADARASEEMVNSVRERINSVNESISNVKLNNFPFISGIILTIPGSLFFADDIKLLIIFLALALIILAYFYIGPLGCLRKKYEIRSAETKIANEFSRPEIEHYDIKLSKSFPKNIGEKPIKSNISKI